MIYNSYLLIFKNPLPYNNGSGSNFSTNTFSFNLPPNFSTSNNFSNRGGGSLFGGFGQTVNIILNYCEIYKLNYYFSQDWFRTKFIRKSNWN